MSNFGKFRQAKPFQKPHARTRMDPSVIIGAAYSPALRSTLEHFQEVGSQLNQAAHLPESVASRRPHCGYLKDVGSIF